MGFWPVVEDMIENSDIVVLVGDARMIKLSTNSELVRKVIKHGKELVYAYSKIDLIRPEDLKSIKHENPGCFFVSGTKNKGVKELRLHLKILAKKLKIEEPKIGVVGYPNIGKSALLNALARGSRALVADMPGTTRGVQWVRSGGLRIMDSPGVIPYEDKNSKLVLLGSKHPEKISDPVKSALEVIGMFISKNKSGLEERYNIKIEPLTEYYDTLLEIGKKRGYLKKGGEVDETKTAITIVKDWQKGLLTL
jgi:ribosome biogenesis GTPase A